jgi:hypothetical protein
MHEGKRSKWLLLSQLLILAAVLLPFFSAFASDAAGAAEQGAGVAVGAQYDSTHVYVAPADIDAFVNSIVATFGGQPSKRIVGNVLPVASRTGMQYVLMPVGVLSVFAYQTPVPFPFGEERTGYLVTDMTQAIEAQWPGGVKMQLYWHFKPSTNPPLETIPDNRVYISRDRADNFVKAFVRFSQGNIAADDKNADAGEIGRAGETYRRIRIVSQFGNMLVLVTDGHLPYPFGRETTGYQVRDLSATLEKAKAAGVKILSAPYLAYDRNTAIVEFPGGYIAEVHSAIPASNAIKPSN